MGRNLSPILRRELANLDKDANSRKSAMKALKSYVKDLDSKAIPVFLAQVSETKETGCVSGEYTISLYEVLARVHGVKIVPQIDSIMSTIIKTLASSAGSFPLQQACSRVVPAIARYGIDPTTPEDKRRHIIHSLCRPLSEALLASQECLSSGAAICLKALVESDNWKFASDEMVNKVCQNVAGALEEKSTQTNPHMGLVMALAKHNPLIVEAYARLLINSGLRISNAGLAEGNSQKRFSAIQMINFLMMWLDRRSIYSELDLIIEEMEKCESESDQMAYVKGAAYEALQTAKKIAQEEGSKFENGSGSVTGSNFSRRDHRRRRNLVPAGDRSPATASPESQTLDSFMEYDSLLESPVSMTQISRNMEYDQRSVNRRPWRFENGVVNVSLKDGLFSELARGSSMCDSPSDHYELRNHGSESGEEFAGFLNRSHRNGIARSATPSPQRSRSRINVDNLFTTPRKLIHSLQDPIEFNPDYSEKQSRRFRSPRSEKFEWSPTTNHNRFQRGMIYEAKANEHMYTDGEEFQGVSESVSSTDDSPAEIDVQGSHEAVPASSTQTETQVFRNEKARKKTASKMFFGLILIIVAVLALFLWTEVEDEGFYVVPT
ncbi:hypothetical protein PTKIN_Ptkin01aG0331800 [Pterospermum kingtungense]